MSEPLSRNPIFVTRVITRWDLRQNTARIAVELRTAESIVESALHYGLEQRRKKDAAQTAN